MKKGMFSMMNYYLPLKGMASMHCSANTDMNGENTAIFFGLSGTGKTTLSTDPKRLLIGDDEHGWDDNGVFNFEGGCYAKVINLDKDSEPDIYNAIKRNALLENVTLDENGKIDFADKSVTENTRVSYPINHIQNIVRPISSAPAAQERHLPVRRCLRRSASRLHPDPGADQVLLPVRLHREAGRHRARHHRADPDLLRLLRPGLPRAASDEVRRRARQEDGKERRQGLSGQHRLERHRQAHLHQGHPRHHRRHPERRDPERAHQEDPVLQLRGPHGAARRRSRRSSIRATPTPMLPSGTRRQRIWPPASSRTSSSTRATRPARRWSPQARRLSNCIFSEQAAAMRPVFYCRKIPSGFSGNRAAVRCSHGSSACGRRTLRGFFAHRNGLAMRLRIPCHAKFSAPGATIFPSKLV